MELEKALDKIVTSLKKDPYIQAIYVKGSMGRGEHDEHSDIDLYCLVDERDEKDFLKSRLNHLRAYRELLFHDDIFIIAPQIIAVYDNMLHVDLFTVTEANFKEKDYFMVLYDPDNRLEKYTVTQTLVLSHEDFFDDVIDVAWFLFQYKKSASRGNDIWSVKMLDHVVIHLARVLLHHYCPDRAELGIKTVEKSLPVGLVKKSFTKAMESNTPDNHRIAAKQIAAIFAAEKDWIFSVLNENEIAKIKPLMEKMLDYLLE
ncbi:nucleotidyltransferase domain-containing protein [Virgibacillus kekensis]|uniref:Nucleotidyltransferase domain-containing protein n=1 Tax=Virgibacillus kekensis TaxID=202261 RepID=A0ABV9DNX6_9BACI